MLSQQWFKFVSLFSARIDSINSESQEHDDFSQIYSQENSGHVTFQKTGDGVIKAKSGSPGAVMNAFEKIEKDIGNNIQATGVPLSPTAALSGIPSTKVALGGSTDQVV